MMTKKRILIFNVNWLGDVLFSTAVIRNIRRNFVDSYIACIIPSRCYPILKGNPHLDEIIIFDEKDRHKGLLAKIRFLLFLKSKKFDIVFFLHRSFTRTLIAFLAGIPERIGYYTRKRGWLLTKKIQPPQINSLHRIDYYLSVIEKAGLRVEDRFTEMFPDQKDESIVDDFLKSEGVNPNDFKVVVNPAGNWLPKRWPAGHFAILLDKLITEFNAKVIISAGISDLKVVNEVMIKMKEKPINACGKLSLRQLAQLLKKADIFISSDTGPLHIANSIGAKRIIALFGPTSKLVTGPFPLKNVSLLQKDIGCTVPCYITNCEDNRCMKEINPEEVLEIIKHDK